MSLSQSQRTRIKVCGLTRPEDAQAAAAAGVDAVGLVFYPASPRAVDVEQAAAICRELSPFVTPVALFVDAAEETVQRVLERVPVGLLQFHGNETPEYCVRFGRPWLKALRMRPGIDLEAEAARYRQASGILVDSYRPGIPGGTGEVFAWDRLPAGLAPRLILAGGLNPDNIGQAVAQVRPAAVDVSGGVEQSPGLKSAERIRAFVAAVRAADQAQNTEV